MPITLGSKDVTTKITDAVVEGSASETKLRSLLKDFTPEQRLAIAKDVVDTVASATGDNSRELRELSTRLDAFGKFVLDERGSFFPHTHHAYWMNAGNDLERQANLLDGRNAEEGVRTT